MNSLRAAAWRGGRKFASVLAGAILGMLPGIASSQILWSGDFETGNFLQWHQQSDPTVALYSQIPKYGRPPKAEGEGDYWGDAYYGDGSLLEIVTQPVRQGAYAAKFTVKNSANGAEPDDCDYPYPTCDRRRTELTVQATLPLYYDALPYLSERWISVSHYVPADWNDGGSGFGVIVFQIKPLNEQGLSSFFEIALKKGAWQVNHRWYPEESASSFPWQYDMFYTGNYDGKPYPRSDFWPEGLKDFPDVSTSHAALQSVKKGGWTDWVMQVRFDARGASEGGTGFLTLWKREGDGPWIKVLHILPKQTSRGGMTFDHGIGFKKPASGTNPGGFGIKAGMYMDKNQVWGLPGNRVIYNDNIKVGSETAGFAMMSPDGSYPGGAASTEEAPPRPPELNIVE